MMAKVFPIMFTVPLDRDGIQTVVSGINAHMEAVVMPECRQLQLLDYSIAGLRIREAEAGSLEVVLEYVSSKRQLAF